MVRVTTTRSGNVSCPAGVLAREVAYHEAEFYFISKTFDHTSQRPQGMLNGLLRELLGINTIPLAMSLS